MYYVFYTFIRSQTVDVLKLPILQTRRNIFWFSYQRVWINKRNTSVKLHNQYLRCIHISLRHAMRDQQGTGKTPVDDTAAESLTGKRLVSNCFGITNLKICEICTHPLSIGY